MEREYCTGIVLAAGKGRRMGTETAKQYIELGGRPLVCHSLEAFERSSLIDQVLLMTDEEHLEYCRNEIVKKYGFQKVSSVHAGGKERYETVWKALKVLLEKQEGETWELAEQRRKGYVMIHDGARPFLDEEIIRRAYEGVRRYRACVVGMPVKDTIKITDGEGQVISSPDRRFVWQAQTPQAFELPLAAEAFARQMKEDCSGITDDAMVVELQTGINVHMVEGSYSNIKITTPEDLKVASTFMDKNV